MVPDSCGSNGSRSIDPCVGWGCLDVFAHGEELLWGIFLHKVILRYLLLVSSLLSRGSISGALGLFLSIDELLLVTLDLILCSLNLRVKEFSPE